AGLEGQGGRARDDELVGDVRPAGGEPAARGNVVVGHADRGPGVRGQVGQVHERVAVVAVHLVVVGGAVAAEIGRVVDHSVGVVVDAVGALGQGRGVGLVVVRDAQAARIEVVDIAVAVVVDAVVAGGPHAGAAHAGVAGRAGEVRVAHRAGEAARHLARDRQVVGTGARPLAVDHREVGVEGGDQDVHPRGGG